MKKKYFFLIIMAVCLFLSASALMVLVYVKDSKPRDIPVFHEIQDFI